MTLGQAITTFRESESSVLSDDNIVRILSNLDGRIFAGVHAHYLPEKTFGPYPDGADLTTELLVGCPFEEIYLYYLLALNASLEGNTQRYNNFSAMYNSTFDEFARYYHNRYSPVTLEVIHS